MRLFKCIIIFFVLLFSCKKEVTYSFQLSQLDKRSFLEIIKNDSIYPTFYYIVIDVKEKNLPQYEILIKNSILRSFMVDKYGLSKADYWNFLKNSLGGKAVLNLHNGLEDSTFYGNKIRDFKINCNYDDMNCIKESENKIIFLSSKPNLPFLEDCADKNVRCVIAKLFKLRIPVYQQDVSGNNVIMKGLSKRVYE